MTSFNWVAFENELSDTELSHREKLQVRRIVEKVVGVPHFQGHDDEGALWEFKSGGMSYTGMVCQTGAGVWQLISLDGNRHHSAYNEQQMQAYLRSNDGRRLADSLKAYVAQGGELP